MNGSVFTYYASQVFNEKLQEVNAQKKNFAVDARSVGSAKVAMPQPKLEKDDKIKKPIAKSEEKKNKEAKSKPTGIEHWLGNLQDVVADIAAHTASKKEEQGFVEYFTNKNKSFSELSKLTATSLVGYRLPVEKVNKHNPDIDQGLFNIAKAIKLGKAAKDPQKYDKAFKLLMNQAYWIAFCTGHSGKYNPKDKTLTAERINKYANKENRKKTIATWVKNTENFKKAVEAGKAPVLAKTDVKWNHQNDSNRRSELLANAVAGNPLTLG